jgi:hypothetical protein
MPDPKLKVRTLADPENAIDSTKVARPAYDPYKFKSVGEEDKFFKTSMKKGTLNQDLANRAAAQKQDSLASVQLKKEYLKKR